MALQTTDSQLRMWIIGGLTYFDRPEIREILLDLYQHDPDKAVQRYVAGKFGDQQSAWAVPTLIAALKNKDPDIRWEAAYNLGRIGDKRAVEPLIEVLEQDESSLVRDWAASSLGHLGDEQALIPLLTAYKASQNRSFVGRIIEALGQLSAGQLDTSSTLEILLEALKDENIAIQISAVRALGNLGDKRVIPTLLAVQPSPYAQDSEHLKIAVADAIEKIKNRQPS
jgi:HEAT repeat protein